MESQIAQQVWQDFFQTTQSLRFWATDFQLYRRAGREAAGKRAFNSHLRGVGQLHDFTLEVIGKPETQSTTLEFSVAPYESPDHLRAQLWAHMGDAVLFSADPPTEGFTNAEQFKRWLLARQIRSFEKTEVPLALVIHKHDTAWAIQIYVSREDFNDLCEDVLHERAGYIRVEITFPLMGSLKEQDRGEKQRFGFLELLPDQSIWDYGSGAVLNWEPKPTEAYQHRAIVEQLERIYDVQLDPKPSPIDQSHRNWLIAGIVGIWIGVALLAFRLW
ncbi:MAG: hypothetical protein O9256_00750 [Rhizobiaceae bacterium]|nr:hypothetical protein [Rhizobiaceae bacterium]